MLQHNYLNDSRSDVNQLGKGIAYTIKTITSIVLFMFVLYGTGLAQADYYVKIGNSTLNCTRGADACPANDLTVLDLFLDNINECVTCDDEEPVTGTLYMRINNTTGSVRTSFALYGTLTGGASINGYKNNIFICVGPIEITKGINTFAVGEISFTCGQSLSLTNNYLAYTPANGTTQAICETLSGATKCQDIRPKCGVAASITIRTPLTASASTDTEPCTGSTTGGSIKVEVSGGEASYTCDIFKKGTGNCPTTAPSKSHASYVTSLTVNSSGGNATTTTSLAPGDYCIYITDSKGCTKMITHTIAGQPCCTNPAKPTVCEVPQSNLCPDVTNGVTIKVSNLQANAYYVVKQTGQTDKVQQAPATVTSATALTFTGLVSGLAPTVYGEDRTSTPYCLSDEAKCTDISPCAPTTSGITTQAAVTNLDINLAEEKPNVTAAPNPFNDRIRFSLKSAVTGQGTLELYNMMGQKVKTVFQGRVVAGNIQTIEYSVPEVQRSNLIYVFRVGQQQTTGKLIGLK